MNFFNDIAEYCKEQLLLHGYKLKNKNKNNRDAISIFMNHYHRKIKIKPRELYLSQELEDSIPVEYKNNFDSLSEKVKKGGSIKEHQSKKINEVYNDSLLNDWFVHHLHLGNELEKDGLFVKRTDLVLMAMVFDDAFYAIKVYPHKKWANQEIIKIAYNNWPSMFKEKFFDYNCSHPPLTDIEVQEYRNKHINCPVVMDDGSRYWMGGGYMVNGESMKICYKLIRLRKDCEALEEWLSKNKMDIITEAESKGIIFSSTHEFCLAHNGSEFKLAEKLSGTGFNIEIIEKELNLLGRLLET